LASIERYGSNNGCAAKDKKKRKGYRFVFHCNPGGVFLVILIEPSVRNCSSRVKESSSIQAKLLKIHHESFPKTFLIINVTRT